MHHPRTSRTPTGFTVHSHTRASVLSSEAEPRTCSGPVQMRLNFVDDKSGAPLRCQATIKGRGPRRFNGARDFD